MSDAGSQSLFVVLGHRGPNPYFCSIVQLDKQEDIRGYDSYELTGNAGLLAYDAVSLPQQHKVPIHNGKWVANFMASPKSVFRWVFSPPATSAGGLSILPYMDDVPPLAPLYGVTFNCSTRSIEFIKPPNVTKLCGIAVTVGLDIYFMTHPAFFRDPRPPFQDRLDALVFECYSPADQSWKKLKPFPASLADLGLHSYIVASAVWDDTILLNVDHRQIWAYNVSNDKWYHVHVHADKKARKYGYGKKYKRNRCYAIKGEALVIKNIIYALSDLNFDSVLALSMQKELVHNKDFKYTCSIRSELFVPRKVQQDSPTGPRTRSLARLGDDNLCFIRSCEYMEPVIHQHIQVTYIKLMEEGKFVETEDRIYLFEIPDDLQFHIVSCFSLPEECKTTTSELCRTFIFNPFAGSVAKQDDKTDISPSAGVVPKQVDKEGPRFNIQATSEQVNDSTQTKITDKQESVVRSSPLDQRKKRKLREINRELSARHTSPPIVLNSREVTNRHLDFLNQKLDPSDFEQESVVRSSPLDQQKKWKMREINRELSGRHTGPPIVLNSREVTNRHLDFLNQKLDHVIQHMHIPPFKFRQHSQMPFDQPSASASSLPGLTLDYDQKQHENCHSDEDYI